MTKGEEGRIFKIKKDYIKRLSEDNTTRKRFKRLKKRISIQNINKEKDFNCIFHDCEKIFPNYTRWMLHYKMHLEDKPYVCHICQKGFKLKGNLNVHIRSHSGIKPFICTYNVCNQAFSTKANLTKHIINHIMRQEIEKKYF